jgi:hypothetical protein
MRTQLLVLAALAVPGCMTDEHGSGEPPDLATLRCAQLAPCQPVDAAVVRFGSTSDLEHRLIGAWQFCGPAGGPFGLGIELTPEHEMFVLEEAANGSCQRGARGTWHTLDVSEQNPEGTYQLSVEFSDGAFTALIPKFSANGSGFADHGVFGDREFQKLPSLL